MRPKKKRKVSVTIIGAVIGAVAIVVGAILTPVVQHLLETPGNNNDVAAKIDPVVEYFPLFVGSTRTYTVGGTTPTVGGGPTVITNSTYTEKVIMVTSGSNDNIRIYKVEQTGGEIYDMDCTGFGTRTPPAEKWYVTDKLHVYVACTQDELGVIIDGLMKRIYSGTPTSSSTGSTAILTFPLETGNKWSAFGDLPLPDDEISYSWYVEEMLDYSVPAGKFKDCYRIVLYTASGTNIRYFCNGIGSVAMEYHHNGMPADFRVELSSYSLTGNP